MVAASAWQRASSGLTDDEWAPALDQALTGTAAARSEFSHTDRMLPIMIPADVEFLPELPAHDLQIEHINEEAFGPGRFTRAAYAIREGGPHERQLSFVAVEEGEVIASVRMTRIAAGDGRALLLGPLAVRPAHKNLGIGRKLVAIVLEAAAEAGAPAVVLVGDEPYYGPLGFKRIPRGQISMPRPVDLNRLLAVEFAPGALDRLSGEVMHADRVRTPQPA